MWIKLERWGIDVGVCDLIVRLVLHDVYIRIPLAGELAWNPVDFTLESWKDLKAVED